MSLDAKTQNARSKTLTNSSGRWSVDESLKGKGLEALYAKASGSIYTAMGGGNLPAGAVSPGLNEQIGSGMNRTNGGQSFFGFGRGNDRGSAENLGSENIAGGGRKQQPPKQRGEGGVLGFTTFRVPMTDHDYGANAQKVEELAQSSWYTQGLKGPKKYGTTMTGLGGRSKSSRGREDGGAGSGGQSKY
tara:strand:+ start:34529 stop:35095 length:567 start_codon:yes stop_codon:yes gene_type:complete